MRKEERRAFDTINRRARGSLFCGTMCIGQYIPNPKLHGFLAKFDGGPEGEEAFQKLILESCIAVVKQDLADKGRIEPGPYFAIETGLQVAQNLLAERDHRERNRKSFEHRARILELIVLACWEVESSRPSRELEGVPASLATDVAVAKGLGLELIDVQTSLNSAKGLILSGTLTGGPIVEAWKAFHKRAQEVWPSHRAAVEGGANA